jgi:plasmid stability protein
MGQVLIRNIDDAIIERLKAHATARRQSLEQTLRDILAEAAGRLTRSERVARADRIRAMTPRRLEDSSTALIRADRDSR